MMEKVKVVGPLGRILVHDILIYYDEPLLFLAQTLSGQYILALYIDADETNQRWFYLPISQHRLERVLNGHLVCMMLLAHQKTVGSGN